MMTSLKRRAFSLLKPALRFYRCFNSAAVPTHANGDALFAAFVKEHMDGQAYLKAYPDVRSAGFDPVEHWLEFGMAEGRLLYPGAVVVAGDAAAWFDEEHWKHFTWRGKHVAVRNVRPIRPSLVSQIRAQARHDPSVVAAGSLALAGLRQFDRRELLHHAGFDVRSIFAAIPERPDAVLITPHLRPGAAANYGADLAGALSALGGGRVLVIVTEDTAETAGDWEIYSRLAPFRAARLVFWRDVCGPNNHNPVVFARLMNALRPSRVVVIDSRLGLDMVAGFGRGLSKYARLCCVYFSLGTAGFEAPAGARFAPRTMQFSLTLTDNTDTVATLRRQWGELSGPGVALLPPRLEPAGEQAFAARQAAHRARAESRARPFRWVWVSRLEPAKGTAILAELARLRPSDQFDLFGPASGSLGEAGLALPNVAHRGVLADLAAADFTGYDGFLFTSQFEGMPNTVLEMSQHSIPMLLADVGGLRDTFDDAAVRFVRHGESAKMTADAFSAALDKLAKLAPDETLAMTKAARAQALARHAPDVHLRGVANLFGDTAHHV